MSSPQLIRLGRSVDLGDGYQCDVLLQDSAGRTWLSWPFRTEHNDTDPKSEILRLRDLSPAIEALQRKLGSSVDTNSKVSVLRPETGDTNESPIKVEMLHNAHGTTWFAWPSTLEVSGEAVDPALMPEPQILDVIKEKELEFARQNASLLLSNSLSIRVLLGQQPVPDATVYGPGAIFVGFKREYLYMTTLDRLWHISRSLTEPVLYNRDTTGSTAFRAITETLEIQVLDPYISKEHKMLGSGASFEVTVGIALRDSTMPTYSDGTARTQWRRGELLVFKKPRRSFGVQDTMQSLGRWSTAIADGAASSQARISRAVIHELRILTHAPLREHNNLLHLFGIIWDSVNIKSSGDICPILVEPFADQGTLSQHVKYLEAKEDLSWSIKIDFCKQIRAGLQVLHSCNIFHGDIKPENILVYSNASGESSTLKLSDFGFSIIQESGVKALQADGAKQVEFLGATRAWSAPEICALLDNSIRTLSLDMARLADIYSFGLVASLIALGGKDPFHSVAVAELDESTEKDIHDIEDSFRQETQADSSRHEYFLQVLTALVIEKEDGESDLSSRLSSWIPRLLALSPEERVQDISSVLISTLDSVSPMAVTGQKQMHTPKADFTLGRYRLFYWKGRMHQISVTGVALEVEIQILLQEDDALCMQIFGDLKKEADAFELDRWYDEQELDLLSRAHGAYYSYQAFYAYAYGFCTPQDTQDMSTALRYLEASAAGGYIMSLVLIGYLEREYPEQLQEVVAELPVLEAMAAWVEVGPKFDMTLWFLCCSFLRKKSPEKYNESIKKLRLSGYAELGENNPGDSPDNMDLSFRGPDIRYLWVADGTIEAFEKLLGIVSVDELILDFKSGRFSSDGRNQNGETALYICCRSGYAEMTLALLSSFGWARKQAEIANVNGRLPLHWLQQFEEEFVAEIGDALLEGGANMCSADKYGLSAIDYAVLSERRDVITYLLSKRSPPFTSLDQESADGQTLYKSVVVGDEETTRIFLPSASLVTLVEVLNEVAKTAFESRLYNRSRSAPCLELVFSAIRQSNDKSPELRSRIALALTASIVNGHSDLFESILSADILHEPLSSKESHLMIITAAIRSQVALFKRALEIPTIWTVEHSQSVIDGMTQWESPNHWTMVEALLQHLNEVGQARAAVNYSESKSSCPPGCSVKHKHSFPQTKFQRAITQDSYAVARLLNPYVDHESNVPTTLYHLLESPGKDILKQIAFLLELGPEHRRYVCDPLTGRNVLHVAIMNNEKYPTTSDFIDVLKTLKEWFLDAEGAGEDISATDNSGCTALHFAAQFICPEAVEFLLSCGAQKSSLLSVTYQDIKFPYDIALVQLSRVLEVLNTSSYVDGSGGTLAMGVSQHFPIETTALRSAHRYLPKLCKVLTLFSKDSAEDPSQAVETMLISGGDNYDILGLSPTSLRIRRVLTRLSRGLVWELWGVLPFEDKELRAHICRRDELEPMEVAMKIAQCTDPVEAEILGGAGYADETYVYRFKVAVSKEKYEAFPFHMSERLQKFFLGDGDSPREDKDKSDNEAPVASASVETRQISEGTGEGTSEESAKAAEKRQGQEEKPESGNSSGQFKTVWISSKD